jgi:hypothetical protein
MQEGPYGKITNKLDLIWKEEVLVHLRYYADIYMTENSKPSAR